MEIQLLFKSTQKGSLASDFPDQQPEMQVFYPRAQQRAGHTAPDSESPSPALTVCLLPKECSAALHSTLTTCTSQPPVTGLAQTTTRPGDKVETGRRQTRTLRNRLSTWTLSLIELSPVLSYRAGSTFLFYCTQTHTYIHTHGKHTTGLTSLKAVTGCRNQEALRQTQRLPRAVSG